MRVWLLGIALAACSRSASAPAPLASLIVPEATSVAAWRPTEFPILAMFDEMPDMYRCWRTLESQLEGVYQVFVPGNASYTILVGNLPRVEVERCAMQMLVSNRLYDPDTESLPHDGAFTVVPTRMGNVYAAWRDGRVIAGRRADVERALATHEPPAWVRAGELPPAFTTSGFVAISSERMFSALVGVTTTRWKMTLDAPPQPWPERELLDKAADALEQFGREQARIAERKAKGLPPEEPKPPRPPRPFTSRLELEYSTPADAARAGQVIASNTFAIPLEEHLGAALAKLPQTITGSTLTLRFDQDSFPGVELDKLQAWLASLQQQAH